MHMNLRTESLTSQHISTRFRVLWNGSLTDRDELSIKKRTLNVEIPANLVDRCPGATEGWRELEIVLISIVSTSHRTG